MREIWRAFLVTLAVLSNLAVVTPAAAGMVATPRPDPVEREAALDRASKGLPGAGPALRELPTADLLLLAGLPESHRRAANDALVVLLVFAVAVLFVAFLVTIIIIDRVHRHMHHMGAGLEPAPAAPAPE